MRKFTEDHKRKISEALKGHSVTDAIREKFSAYSKTKIPWNKGKKNTQQSGKNHWNWKGGITRLNKNKRKEVMNSFEYKLWRKSVFERDGYACIWCGDNKGGNLEADHIKPWSDYPELRFAIDNGRTLCHKCHMTTKTYGGIKSEIYGNI